MGAASAPQRGIFLGKGTLPRYFITKCLNLGITEGKHRIAGNSPRQLMLSHGAKPRSSPKGSNVPHARMLAPSPQQRPSMEDWHHPFAPGPCPAQLSTTSKSRSSDRIPGETKLKRNTLHGAANDLMARAKSCPRSSRQGHREPRQSPQNLTLHLCHRSCQNEAVAVTASSEPR